MTSPRLYFAAFIWSLSSHYYLANGSRSFSKNLLTLSHRVQMMDLSNLNLLEAGSKASGLSVGSGVITYRSSVVAGLSQLDRGEDAAAIETFRVAIASLTLDTTSTFVLPIISTIIDKMVKKYGSNFKNTLSGMKNYNQMLGNSILNQVSNVAIPGMLDNANNVIDTLDTLKNQIKVDFTHEVESFLKSSQAYDDLVKPLKSAKSWAKVAKWADFLMGPIFDAANIAFSGWQLHGAIQSGDQLAVASSSISIAGSIIGIGAFVVGSLVTAGSVIAAVAGPVGAIIGCLLSLAALIIDIINEYNPEKVINEHLILMHTLSEVSRKQMAERHYELLQKITGNGIQAGFGTLFDVNQAMLVKARIEDHWDTIKGMRGGEERLVFNPELVKPKDDYLVVGNLRVFDKAKYANWAFKPTGTEEIGYNYYGKRVNYNQDGFFVRLNTELVTNKTSKMWFWLNGANVTTFAKGKADLAVDDNIDIGDFRTLYRSFDRAISVNTGGGDDLVELSGVISCVQQLEKTEGRCLILKMGQGYDTVSFEAMDMREEKRKWFGYGENLENYELVVGIVVDVKEGLLSYVVQGGNKSTRQVHFGSIQDVEEVKGSPMDDTIKVDDSNHYKIKESQGYNVYEIHYNPHRRNARRHTIEDNADTPGNIVLLGEMFISWTNIAYFTSTSTLVVVFGRDDIAEIFLRRSKPGLDRMTVTIKAHQKKKLFELDSFEYPEGFILPYVPYRYHFNLSLVSRGDFEAYVELYPPRGEYPTRAVTYHIRFMHRRSYLILTKALLEVLRKEQYQLTAKRSGNEDTEGSWTLELTKPRQSGGWHISIGHFGYFVLGVPRSFQYLFDLIDRKDNRLDIFREYQTIINERSFDSTNSYYGDDDPEKVVFRYPKNFTEIHPPAKLVIDLKGPKRPSVNGKNELVIHARLLSAYIKNVLWRYMIMKLERASLQDDWHLKIYSNWGKKVLRVVITLKNVHTIVADKAYNWKLILDLYDSQELAYNLNDIIEEKYYLEYVYP